MSADDKQIRERKIIWALLTICFFAISALRFAMGIPVEWVNIPDSAWYAASANSFFCSSQFKIAGQFNAHSLPLYSILISPAYFFTEIENTFTAIKLINSLLMTSAIFPIFLFAKKFMTLRSALAVAFLSVMIGPMFYTCTIMAREPSLSIDNVALVYNVPIIYQ